MGKHLRQLELTKSQVIKKSGDLEIMKKTLKVATRKSLNLKTNQEILHVTVKH